MHLLTLEINYDCEYESTDSFNLLCSESKDSLENMIPIIKNLMIAYQVDLKELTTALKNELEMNNKHYVDLSAETKELFKKRLNDIKEELKTKHFPTNIALPEVILELSIENESRFIIKEITVI